MLAILLQVLMLTSACATELPSYCQSTAPSKNYARVQANLKTRMDLFANHPLVATEADRVLSQLLAAKSPAIVEWMGKRDFTGKSENEVAREWRRYYAYSFTLQKYPTENSKLNFLIEDLVEGVYKNALDKKKQAHLIKIFSEAKKQALGTVMSFHLPVKEAQSIQNRVAAVDLHFLKKLKGSSFAKSPLEAISWGVAYDPVANKINIGIDELKYDGDPTLFAVFAHEIGHSFDSCRWGAFFQNAYPFESVITCLRTAESTAAKTRDDSKLDSYLSKGIISKELFTSLKAHPTCNQLQYPANGLQGDQSLEAFADWFSAEVVANSAFIKVGLRADLCETTPLVAGSSYLSNQVRLERVYLAQPKLSPLGRKDSPKVRYCEPPKASL